MASVTIVQSTSSADLSNNATLGAGLTQGNTLLLVAAQYNNSGTQTPPVTYFVGGTSYTSPAAFMTSTSPSTNNNITCAAFLVPVISAMAGATALSFTVTSSSGGAVKLYGLELSVPTGFTLTLDQHVPNDGTGTSFATSTITTAFGSELAIFAIPVYSSTVSSGQIPNPPWTEVGGNNFMQLWYQNGVAASTNLSLSGTLTGSDDWASVLFTVYAAGTSTNISVSDFAGAVESYALTVAVPVSDVAAMVSSQSESVSLSFSDFAGSVETDIVSATVGLVDFAGVIESRVVSVSATFTDVAASFDSVFVPTGAPNPLKPAIVLVAAAYPVST